MKILLLAPQPFFVDRGTPIAVRAVAETLASAGHAVDLVTFPGGRDVAMPGVQHVRSARPPLVRDVPVGLSWQKMLCGLSLFATAFRLLRRERHDCIHAVEDSVFLALLLRLIFRTKLVYDMDSIMSDQIIEKWPRMRPLGRLMRGLERVAMRGSDQVLCVCLALAQRVAEDAPETPSRVLHDFPLWDDNAVAPRIRDASHGRLVALYVGNLQHYQGVDLLLRAARMLPADSAIDIVVVGGLPEDARRTGGVRIRFLGPMPLDNLPGLLVQADILVSPRLHGVNTPMKVYSYMMASRPILATAILSHTQVLDESCALLVQPDAEALAAGLMTLERDPALRRRLGDAARERVETRYSRARFAEILLAAYDDLEPASDARLHAVRSVA
ncbi:glycosyltransferase family 4 protein [Falsiroseomonas sp. E2-1-a20]|uniref:glycosyltransferase family 4 protein n=1 Tax=Falsiroseomonas sp. E2-1-a20 TaxID=3239300 RepID=UPI003F2DE9E8